MSSSLEFNYKNYGKSIKEECHFLAFFSLFNNVSNACQASLARANLPDLPSPPLAQSIKKLFASNGAPESGLFERFES